ncbi:PH domain-containing protein [Trujillonella endophytica]|uniref:PH domain-containing protein n=1 Tax=Trujillonella endophytica TaxID=673521 RepID=A0A1H8TU12_9ACTN|nr:PH domain-containing protein [Trujillella endophytica]SEO94335.1 PH domain-containing protein [Trujillella endophytica]
MPATEAPARVSAVPRRLRLVCAAAAIAVTAAMTVVGLLLPSSSVGVVEFGWVDQVAIIGVGVCLGGGILTFGRSRVDADASGVAVRNLFVRHVLPWSAVRSVRFDRHSSWASLLLTNGDEVSVLAIQAADTERAVRAVEDLRALLAAAQAAEPPRPPLLYED